MLKLHKFHRAALKTRKYPLFSKTSRHYGINVQTVKGGDNEKFPSKGDLVAVHYEAFLEDGREIDSTRKKGQPFKFQLGQGLVIRGLDVALPSFSVGQRSVLTIPPELGYGGQQVRNVIPPDSVLIFDIELVDILKVYKKARSDKRLVYPPRSINR